MPNNKFDAKSFNAEAFKYKVGTIPNLKMNEIKRSAALAANPDSKSVFASQNGTGYIGVCCGPLCPLSLLWQAVGNLNNGGNDGVSCANLNNALGTANWNIGARASGR